MNKEFRIITSKDNEQIVQSRDVTEWKDHMTLEEIKKIFRQETSNINFPNGLTIKELRS